MAGLVTLEPFTGAGSYLIEPYLNGGFFVMEPAVLDMIEGDGTELEKGLLTALSERGQLMAYRHEGFWQSMDTLRDKTLLNKLWDGGDPPWRTWA